MQYNIFSLIITIISIFFFSFHLMVSIKYKRFLNGLKPYAWVKESLDKVNINIKLDIISIVLSSVLFVLICVLKIWGV